MRLRSEIRIPAPRERAWRVLGDVETLSGSSQVDLDGSSVEWLGTLRPVDVDEDASLVTLRMQSREAHGPGLAVGTLEARVSGAGADTVLVLEGDVRVTGERGRPEAAQAAGDRLLADLARQLEQRILAPEARPAAEPATEAADTPPQPAVPFAGATPALSSGSSVPRLLRTLGPPAAAAATVIVVASLLGRLPQRRRRGRLAVRP